MIGLTSLAMMTFHEHILGGVYSIIFSSRKLIWEIKSTNFFGKLWNFMYVWQIIYSMNHHLISEQQKLAKKYLGLSYLLDIERNTSFIFINQLDVLTSTLPKLPNLITFNSFHLYLIMRFFSYKERIIYIQSIMKNISSHNT